MAERPGFMIYFDSAPAFERLDDVPKYAITLTVPALVLFLASLVLGFRSARHYARTGAAQRALCPYPMSHCWRGPPNLRIQCYRLQGYPPPGLHLR